MPQSLRHRNGIPRKAFTLIELLVVVAIIALLISILLPSLSRAREQARSVVCLAHERGMGQGMQMYCSENKDWLPGPNTSGYWLSMDGLSFNGSTYSYTAKNERIEPTQNQDWISPTMGRILTLPKNSIDRMMAIFNNDLRCPSNTRKYDGEYTGSSSGTKVPVDAKNLNYSSYAAVLTFHGLFGLQGPGKPISQMGPNGTNWPFRIPTELDDPVYGPASYMFKLGNVGPPANKVYVCEGTRYVSSGQITFNAFTRQIDGGNFMTSGPSLAIQYPKGDPCYRDAKGNVTPEGGRYA